MTTVSDVKTQLQVILSAVTGFTGENQVLTWLPRWPDKYPQIGMYYDEADFEPAEINSQWAEYTIQLVVFIAFQDEKTLQEDQDTYGSAIMAALRAKADLNSTSQGYRVSRLKNDIAQSANGNACGIVAIDLIVKKEEDN